MILDKYKGYFDKNGLILPQQSWSNSGNGVLYLSIATILDNNKQEDWLYYKATILKCFNNHNILMRTPANEFGQESWDDYLGLAVACLFLNETDIPQMVLWSLICHAGFMWNTDSWGDLFKSWMPRFVIVWLIMGAAAFPWLKGFYKYIISLYFWLFPCKLDIDDESGTQLQWLQLKALSLLGNSGPLDKWLNNIKQNKTTLFNIMEPYYSAGHPIVEGFKQYE